jgi:hypothetical protein
MTELLDKLNKVYHHHVEADIFGRREALPAEIQNLLSLERFNTEAQPQEDYGRPQELPPGRIPEPWKHHITRSGK